MNNSLLIEIKKKIVKIASRVEFYFIYKGINAFPNLPSFEETNEILDQTPVFFLLGMGRSGTKFMSKLLGSDGNALVFHEPLLEDRYAAVRSYNDRSFSDSYIRLYRKRWIAYFINRQGCKVYGETNSYLRYMAGEIKGSIPNCKILILVRDPRKVIRSALSRSAYTKSDEFNETTIFPTEDDAFFSKWRDMDRFEKVCWYWLDTYDKLLKITNEYVIFEKVLDDYDYFKENLLDKIDLNISKSVWEDSIEKVSNNMTVYNFPDFNNWTKIQKDGFYKICGEFADRFGYKSG